MNFEQQDRKSLYERRKNLLYLIHQYLLDIGLSRSCVQLQQEADLSKEIQVCDNVDLETMYMEFCSYYKLKFGKNPKIVKRIDGMNSNVEGGNNGNAKNKSLSRASITLQENEKILKEKKHQNPPSLDLNQSMTVSTMNCSPSTDPINVPNNNLKPPTIYLTKPLLSCYENATTEWKDMAEIICRDLIQTDYRLTWENICGADNAKSILYESVIVPLEYPDLFTGTVKPWKSVLMHGPPGTGKTMLAKALCTGVKEKFAFFNVAASTVTSKWRGESEKLIRVLFEVAKLYAPSIIFIDEIDGLASQRDSNSDHEATKRFKNEFLTLIDGLSSENTSDIFLLANTNLPWEIDAAFLRRFERKILIELPDAKERLDIFKLHLPEIVEWDEYCLNQIADSTNMFTGDEIRIACKEASMMLVRKNIQRRRDNSQIKKGIKFHDLMTSISQISPASKYLLDKHREWNQKFGNHL